MEWHADLQFDIDINDKRNGIRLPDTTAAAHKGAGVHGKGYKQYVFDKLSVTNGRKGFLNAFFERKQSLFEGVSFKTIR